MPEPKRKRLPVTVAVPVKNEEASIFACLDRLERFAEVVVIDSGSTDRTRDIAVELGARIIDFQWNGRYPKKRNWFLLNETPTQPWVLFLDADELVDDRFCDAVDTAVAEQGVDGYWLRYTNHFLGRPMRFGIPQRKLALFRVGKALYEFIEDDSWSTLDMEIHEHPIVDGTVGEIRTPIDHIDHRGLAHWYHRHVEYAIWEAERLRRLEADPGAWQKLTRRQKLKYRSVRHWWFPAAYFLGTYFGYSGFLDGRAGFVHAREKAWYFRMVRELLLESDTNSLS